MSFKELFLDLYNGTIGYLIVPLFVLLTSILGIPIIQDHDEQTWIVVCMLKFIPIFWISYWSYKTILKT
jgi:hypothetical protein